MLTLTSLIGQLVHPVVWEGMGDHYFIQLQVTLIRVYNNLKYQGGGLRHHTPREGSFNIFK